MIDLEIALIGWEDRARGSARLLGRLADPDLVEQVRQRLAAQGRRKLAELEPPLRLVGDDTPENEGGDQP